MPPATKTSTDQLSSSKSSIATSKKSKSSLNVASKPASPLVVDAHAPSTPPTSSRVELPEVLPQGMQPLFLASATQELFKIKGGEHVTAEKPLKAIPKADILQDLYTR